MTDLPATLIDGFSTLASERGYRFRIMPTAGGCSTLQASLPNGRVVDVSCNLTWGLDEAYRIGEDIDIALHDAAGEYLDSAGYSVTETYDDYVTGERTYPTPSEIYEDARQLVGMVDQLVRV